MGCVDGCGAAAPLLLASWRPQPAGAHLALRADQKVVVDARVAHIVDDRRQHHPQLLQVAELAGKGVAGQHGAQRLRRREQAGGGGCGVAAWLLNSTRACLRLSKPHTALDAAVCTAAHQTQRPARQRLRRTPLPRPRTCTTSAACSELWYGLCGW